VSLGISEDLYSEFLSRARHFLRLAVFASGTSNSLLQAATEQFMYTPKLHTCIQVGTHTQIPPKLHIPKNPPFHGTINSELLVHIIWVCASSYSPQVYLREQLGNSNPVLSQLGFKHVTTRYLSVSFYTQTHKQKRHCSPQPESMMTNTLPDEIFAQQMLATHCFILLVWIRPPRS